MDKNVYEPIVDDCIYCRKYLQVGDENTPVVYAAFGFMHMPTSLIKRCELSFYDDTRYLNVGFEEIRLVYSHSYLNRLGSDDAILIDMELLMRFYQDYHAARNG